MFDISMPNHLTTESSPYLRQHADNPVNWWPWCDEALAAARAQEKPILLSIGYSACHWCHVMAHESFEDEATAAVMNQQFVAIKVDREERPDIDQIYMNALHLLGQQGGWPLTMFLTPDGAPIWGSDVGGIPATVPAFTVCMLLLLGVRVRIRLLAAIAGATAAVLVVIAEAGDP